MADNGTQAAIDQTVQSRVKSDALDYGGIDILPLLVRAGELVPAWWSRARDMELSRLWKRSDHISGAISMFQTKTASVPLKVVPRDSSIKRWVKLADQYNQILVEGSDFGGGWHTSLCLKAVEDYLTQDNGFFIEVIGYGRKDGPIVGVPLGMAHLDAQNCQRTSSPEYPVIYTDTDGRRYKLHASRVIFSSAMPSSRARMHGVGFSPLSRMVATAQHLVDIATYEQEKLGSRPPRQAIIAESGISAENVVTAFLMAENSMDNQSLGRYAKTVVVGPKVAASQANPIKLNLIDLNSTPDGFSKTESITLGMFLIALALNIPPRWIWPATQAGATKADAMFQHVAGMGGGIGLLLKIFQQLIGGSDKGNITGKFLPPGLALIFDFQDDEQDRAKAEIGKLRAENRANDLTSGVIDVRVARQQALEAGDISEAQYNDLELKDGRLPGGEDVLTLFYSADPDMQRLLSLSVGDPLDVQSNLDNADFVLDRIRDQRLQAQVALVNVDRANQRAMAEQAVAALTALEKMYLEARGQQQAEISQGETESPVNEQPENEVEDEGGSSEEDTTDNG